MPRVCATTGGWSKSSPRAGIVAIDIDMVIPSDVVRCTEMVGDVMVVSDSARIDGQGRVVIPAGIRHALGLESGAPLAIRVVDGEIRITTRRAAMERARAAVMNATKGRRFLVEELIAERRSEAARE